jgi:hypothetical protein
MRGDMCPQPQPRRAATVTVYTRDGSVSVFGIFSVFLKVITIFGIGIAKYRGIGIGIFNPYKTY